MLKITEVGTKSQAVSQEATSRLVEKTLYQIVTQGAQKMLCAALEEEVNAFLANHATKRLDGGKPRIVRNGYAGERKLLTPAGALTVRVPRTRDRDETGKKRENFQSALVPPYLRRATSLDEFIPFLYLKGVSTNDFSAVLSELTGNPVSLSVNTVVRLKSVWEEEFKKWSERDLSAKRYVYFWADAIHLKIRLGDEKACILCIIAADAEGKKELLAIQEGYRESETAWRDLLMDLKQRGLTVGPALAIADGALGFWSALRKEFSGTKEQRCWVHKTRNVLEKLPDSLQGEAKKKLHEIYQAPTRSKADSAFDTFIELFEAKYPKAAQCLLKDRETSLTFYSFPAEHWQHIRSTNVIESMFATVRLRTYKTKGAGCMVAAKTMLFKMAESASGRWRKLRGYKKIPLVMAREIFIDGELQKAA
jgi:putative transposase